ncbi:hypothetical protein SteCoe_24173 [Stentor coeruleus]|uniref:Uncharacterized protein n=1 Tax=Stentor coeruleus TaxID=5963 RepID=A0A1R2BIM7_9CILI|nr:hypothetical protein SteCoe_24173 [Stentor coeruleus]
MQHKKTESPSSRLILHKYRMTSEEETDLDSNLPVFYPKLSSDFATEQPENIDMLMNEEPTRPNELSEKAILNALEILKSRTDSLKLQLNSQIKALVRLNRQELAIERIEKKLLFLKDRKSRKNICCNSGCMDKCCII